VFERFTDRARRVVVLAQEEARMLNHNYIGTEHLLLGLVHEGQGVACRVLASMDISLDVLRSQVEEIIGRGQAASAGAIPFTARAKKILELALREALQLGHDYIGTEHILLGLVREGEGVGAQVLQQLGADLHRVRQEIIVFLGKQSGADDPAPHAATEAPPPYDWPRCPKCRAFLLEGDLGLVAREVAAAGGEDRRRYVLLFCRRCGHILRVDHEP
jgi:ATP-dependent Clp protease ATP-binding subunit ClpC